MTSVDMGDPGAGNPHTATSTHPNLERQLEVLSSKDYECYCEKVPECLLPPHPQPGVVPAQLLEPGPVDSEESTGVSGRVVRLAVMTSLLLFLKKKVITNPLRRLLNRCGSRDKE